MNLRNLSLACLMALLSPVTFGAAKTFYVSTQGLHEVSGVTWGTYRTDDGVDHDAYTNLQQAVTYACDNNWGSTIWVENGYVLDEGSTVYNKVDTRLRITGWGCAITVRSRSGDWRTGAEIRGDAHTRCVGGDGGAKLIGFRLVDGVSTNGNGGGVTKTHNVYTMSLYNCLIANCSAHEGSGGGSFGVPLYNCVVSNCLCESYRTSYCGSGGGLSGASAYDCTFDHCTAQGSVYEGGSGGGCSGDATYSNCTFRSCVASNPSGVTSATGTEGIGGGISGGKNTRVMDCIFTNCTATGSGGAIVGSSGGFNIQAYNCTSGRYGGAINGGKWANVTVRDCQTSGGYGGGVYSAVVSKGYIGNCQAVTGGGGASGCTLTNVTVVCNITTNTASYGQPYGGGLYQGTAVGCVIAGNSTFGPEGKKGDSTYGHGYGGGTKDTTLIGCVISNNFAWGSHGGVSGGSARNCIIVGNRTHGVGGGGGEITACEGTLVINNKADSSCGGIYTHWNKTSHLLNVTVAGNTNLSGVAVIATSITNCVVWGNSVPQKQSQVSCASVGYTCYPEAVEGNAKHNVNSNPRLATVRGKAFVAQNGACRGKGLVYEFMANPAKAFSRDWYGEDRLVGGKVDLGWVSVRPQGFMLLVR